MNRRDALKTMALGAVALATPVFAATQDETLRIIFPYGTHVAVYNPVDRLSPIEFDKVRRNHYNQIQTFRMDDFNSKGWHLVHENGVYDLYFKGEFRPETGVFQPNYAGFQVPAQYTFLWRNQIVRMHMLQVGTRFYPVLPNNATANKFCTTLYRYIPV